MINEDCWSQKENFFLSFIKLIVVKKMTTFQDDCTNGMVLIENITKICFIMTNKYRAEKKHPQIYICRFGKNQFLVRNKFLGGRLPPVFYFSVQ